MSKDKIEQLKAAVGTSGFPLEWETTKVLEDLDFEVTQNALYHPEYGGSDGIDRMVEIDVLAEAHNYNKREGKTLIIECKGTDVSNTLVLIESPGANHSYKTLVFENEKVLLTNRPNIFTDRIQGPYDCYTGDFFCQNKDRYQKVSTQLEQSNLYKGIVQINHATNAYFKQICTLSILLRLHIEPVLVTNANITVVRFSKSITNPDIEEVPWAVYRNSLTYSPPSYISGTEWKNDDDELIHLSRRALGSVWIVNINHLRLFLEGPNRSYNHKPSKKITV